MSSTTIAIASRKGGSGKSTLTRNLGDIFSAENNQRTLLIDADPQASLTIMCGLSAESAGLVEVLNDNVPISEVAQQIDENLFVVTSHPSLSVVERQMHDALAREHKLKRALALAADRFDYVLIDNAPARGVLVINSLTAADMVLIPLIPQVVDVHALRLFLETVDAVRENINPNLELKGVVLNQYDGRTIHHRSAKEQIDSAGLLLDIQIGRSIRIAEASGHGQSLRQYDKDHKQIDAYRQIVKELRNGRR